MRSTSTTVFKLADGGGQIPGQLAGHGLKWKNDLFFQKNVFDTKRYSSDGDHTWNISFLEHLRNPTSNRFSKSYVAHTRETVKVCGSTK